MSNTSPPACDGVTAPRAADRAAERRILVLFAHPALEKSRVKRVLRGLEELLLAEMEADGEQRDAGWDTESLRGEFGEVS